MKSDAAQPLNSVVPYYEDGSVTIYQGNSLDLMPSITADAVVTDPPYGLDFKGAAWDDHVPDWLPLARAVAPVVAFTTAPLTAWDYPCPTWMACWARPASNSRSKLKGGFNHWSPVLIYGDVKFPTDLISLHAIANATEKWVKHPSPKPIKLMRWLIEHTTKPGDTVLDPFMGSGTTLRAAKDLGRKAIGIEIERDYCDFAVQRLNQEVLAI